jgi:hypothetical protein
MPRRSTCVAIVCHVHPFGTTVDVNCALKLLDCKLVRFRTTGRVDNVFVPSNISLRECSQGLTLQ